VQLISLFPLILLITNSTVFLLGLSCCRSDLSSKNMNRCYTECIFYQLPEHREIQVPVFKAGEQRVASAVLYGAVRAPTSCVFCHMEQAVRVR
jgi:hypothetical protein